MKIKINIEFNFWLWLAKLSWRKLAKVQQKHPVGIPGERDPENKCPAFEPRERQPGDYTDCETDGHYLCWECCHMSDEAKQRRNDDDY